MEGSIFDAAEREGVLDRLVELLRDDAQIEGLVLVGSMAGTPDRWSDVDLEVAVAEHAVVAEVADRWVRQLYLTLPVVHHFQTEFGSTTVRGLLLENVLEVDLSFTAVDELSLWQPARAVFDRHGHIARLLAQPSSWKPDAPDWSGEAGFAWHDVLHAAVAVHRNRLWQALWYMQRIRNRTMILASQRRGWYADFFDYVDDLPADELSALLPTLAGSLEPATLLAAIDAATRAFVAELQRGDPGLAAKLEGPLLAFVDAVREASAASVSR